MLAPTFRPRMNRNQPQTPQGGFCMQINIDFEGKKTERVTFAATDELKANLKFIASFLNIESSKLAEQYVTECVVRDIGVLLVKQARDNNKLSLPLG